MTPDEAQIIGPGLTEGRWVVSNDDDEYNDTLRVLAITNDGQIIRGATVADEIDNPHDARLIAAAPAMRDYIAAQTWEWRQETRREGDTVWEPMEWRSTRQRAEDDVAWWRKQTGVELEHRLVCRPVGPTEVVK